MLKFWQISRKHFSIKYLRDNWASMMGIVYENRLMQQDLNFTLPVLSGRIQTDYNMWPQILTVQYIVFFRSWADHVMSWAGHEVMILFLRPCNLLPWRLFPLWVVFLRQITAGIRIRFYCANSEEFDVRVSELLLQEVSSYDRRVRCRIGSWGTR